jgi:hypothetical protein
MFPKVGRALVCNIRKRGDGALELNRGIIEGIFATA